MADGFELASSIWEARPKPFSTLFSGSTLRGAAWGGVTGAAVGGGLPGAAVGAGLGAAFSVVTAQAQRTATSLRQLERSTRSFVEQYRAFSPAVSRLSHQFRLLDRRLQRSWAETLEPILKKATQISIEIRERWERIKMQLFQAIEPFLLSSLRFLQVSGRTLTWLLEKLTNILTRVIGGFEKMFRWLGLLPEKEERSRTRGLQPFGIEWPTVEGPLSAAMKRTRAGGPPFTSEEARRGREEEEAEGEVSPGGYLKQLRRFLFPLPFDREKGKKNEVNVEVNVGDSKEMSAVFERVWRQTSFELHKLEADDVLQSFSLQREGTYV